MKPACIQFRFPARRCFSAAVMAVRAAPRIFVLCACAAAADTLTLPQAQSYLFNNNRDVQIAEMRFLKSLVEVSEAKASYYPTAETWAMYNYQSKANRINVQTQMPQDISDRLSQIGNALGVNVSNEPIVLDLDETVGDYDRFEWGVDISYPLFTGFSRRYSVKSKEAASTVNCLSSIITKDILSLQLGLMYFMWEISFEKVAVQQVYIDQVSEYVVQMRNLYEGGVEPRSKVLEASARLEAAKVELLSAQSSVDSIRLELIDFLRIKDVAAVPSEYPYELSEQVANSRPRPYRPEIESIDSTLSSVRLARRAVLGLRFPSLFVMAGYRFGNPGIVMGGDEFTDWGVAGLQLRWTLYDGQKNWTQREAMRHDIDILKKEREKQLAMWEKKAAAFRLQVEKSHRMITAAELALKAAEAFAEDLHNALSAGAASSGDYLNALGSVAQARYRLAQAKTMRKAASLQLAYALGEKMEF